jgi:hypothetical protein
MTGCYISKNIYFHGGFPDCILCKYVMSISQTVITNVTHVGVTFGSERSLGQSKLSFEVVERRPNQQNQHKS